MIIMINGSFGVGKTSVAKQLLQNIPDTMIFDIEEVGDLVRNITNNVRTLSEDTGDYQDITLWRTLSIQIARELKEKYGYSLIIPKTITNLNYLNELKAGLRQIDPCLYHFCLTASVQTIYKRLQNRPPHPRDSWVKNQIDRCMKAFVLPEFEEYINTEGISIVEVQDDIMKRIKI